MDAWLAKDVRFRVLFVRELRIFSCPIWQVCQAWLKEFIFNTLILSSLKKDKV